MGTRPTVSKDSTVAEAAEYLHDRLAFVLLYIPALVLVMFLKLRGEK